MKTLTTKRIYAYLIFSNLKRTPPREYPDTNEMVVTVDEVLPALEAVSGDFISMMKRADDVNNELAAGKISTEDAQLKIADLQKEVRIYEPGAGMEFVNVEFSPSAFGILSSQFDRWGKGNTEKQIPGWFSKVEDLVAFSKDIKKVV